jgi:hypothetical protein
LWSTFPTVEITPRFHLPKDDAADQPESRRLSFLGFYTPSYRLREKLERSFEVRRFAVTPYAHAEAF